MRPLIFLFPNNRMDSGGNSAQARFLEASRRFAAATAAYYQDRIAGQPFLADILASERADVPTAPDDRPIFVIHWGLDIAMLLDMLQGHDVIYFAHSTGWGMSLPPHVPILCVSRHSMAYWGRHAPNAFIAYVPNIVEVPPAPAWNTRDIDVLVQVRKSSRYLLDDLVPALRPHCRVTVLDGWVDDLAGWLRRSRVYLYDSLEHWIDVGATEGFGLPPLEAIGHGCTVFSSLNDALADYLDPGFNCRKLRVHSLAWDVAEIVRAAGATQSLSNGESCVALQSTDQIAGRLATVLSDVERFFRFTRGAASDIPDIWAARRPSPLQRAKRAVKVLAGV